MGRPILRKRKRVFSLEPNKLAYTMFARNYVKHLMTSLPKISSHFPSSPDHHHQQQQQNFEKLVKFEVDMAMAQSAASTEFAWGNALKHKLLLQRSDDQVIVNGNFFDDFSLQKVKFSQENLEEEEEKKMENGMMKLRKILPGGGGGGEGGGGGGDHFNGDLELLKQTESYIKCLELQVNVLRCLVNNNTINPII